MTAETPTAPTPSQAFALRLFAQVCDGPRVLRDRLLAAGLDTRTIARVIDCAPRTLAKVADGGATPRGVLMRLAGLAVIVDQLRANGVPIAALSGPRHPQHDEVIEHVANQSDIAMRLIARLAREDSTAQLQLLAA